MSEVQTEAEAPKSIVNPKYRNKYKGQEPDWLGQLIADHATATVTKVSKDEKGKEVSTEVPAGIDVDKLFHLAEINGVDVSRLEPQKGSHGFAGRARMTVRNMLQPHAKQRHGLHVPDGKGGKKWHAADAEWLKDKKAPEAPTHDKGGEKFAKVAAVEPSKVAATGKKAAKAASKSTAAEG